MNLLAILSQAAGLPAAKIREMLLALARAVPDMADEVQLLLNSLDGPLSSDKLIELGAVIMAELNDVRQGKLDPRDHASDAG